MLPVCLFRCLLLCEIIIITFFILVSNAYLYGNSHVEALDRITILLRLSTSVIYACRQSVC